MAMQSSAQPASARNPLWDFAVWAYEQEGVKKACLALQNRMGVDVNMVMFLLWLADSGVGHARLAQYMSAALKLSRDWRENFVNPLRGVRNNLKDYSENNPLGAEQKAAFAAVRDRVLACELDMERMQTLATYNLVSDTRTTMERVDVKQGRDHATNNLSVYFAATGVKLDALAQGHVNTILDTIFDSRLKR